MAGWDFSWLGDRMTVERLPWDFDALVDRRARASPDLLDLGTGGGEWLASLPYRPPRTVATEAWPPNVPVARKRLAPLGVDVAAVDPAPDNAEQQPDERRGRLPFADGSFQLVVSRHESYVPAEVARVLVHEGHFVTEQVGPGSGDFACLLDLPPPEGGSFRLDLGLHQLEGAGFDVLEAEESEQRLRFADIGALAWYLKAVPWSVRGFDPHSFEERLRRLHQANRPLEARLYAFWLEARAP